MVLEEGWNNFREAARLAEKLTVFNEAVKYHLQASQPHEAGVALLTALRCEHKVYLLSEILVQHLVLPRPDMSMGRVQTLQKLSSRKSQVDADLKKSLKLWSTFRPGSGRRWKIKKAPPELSPLWGLIALRKTQELDVPGYRDPQGQTAALADPRRLLINLVGMVDALELFRDTGGSYSDQHFDACMSLLEASFLPDGVTIRTLVLPRLTSWREAVLPSTASTAGGTSPPATMTTEGFVESAVKLLASVTLIESLLLAERYEAVLAELRAADRAIDSTSGDVRTMRPNLVADEALEMGVLQELIRTEELVCRMIEKAPQALVR